MYWRFVSGAMRLRAGRLALAFTALGVASALATALFSIYTDVERRVSAEFVSYGANLTVSAPNLPISVIAKAQAAGATAAAPFLYTTGNLNGQPVDIARIDLARAQPLISYWHIEGTKGDCLIGTNLAQRFHLSPGSETTECRITGIVTTGGPEDNELILPFGNSPAASVVEIRAPADRLNAIEATLRQQFPQADIRQVRAIAATETNVIAKVRVTLFLLLALILAITTMSVTSNFSELVMERRGEIGILKAIGAAEPKIASLFVAESVLLALGAAIAGYLCGIVLAGWIGQSVFQIPFAIHVQPTVLLLSAALTVTVALVATALSAGSIWRIQPARILRGE